MKFQKLYSILTFAGLLILFSGCSESPAKAGRVQVISGGEQCAFAGEKFAQPVRVMVQGRVKSLLGGKKYVPCSGVRVKFVPQKGSDLQVESPEAVTDAGGEASCVVSAGKKSGDQYLQILLEDSDKAAAAVRLIAGVKISGNDTETISGEVADQPVSVKIQRDGKPVEGVPVRFDMRASAEGLRSSAEIFTPSAVTGKDGVASTRVRVGKKTGQYQVGVEILSPEKDLVYRSMGVNLFGFNFISVVISVFGGLALFVFGMNLMSDGIKNIAGENMKKIIRFFAARSVIAVLAGTLVTAVLQSSSSSTVMVIGFINAGLLNLTQAIGLIMGANIGSTVTAQLIAFNLSGIAMPAIIAGFIMSLARPRKPIHWWGVAILGFGFLFYGMTMMSSELKVLGHMPSFKTFFQLFDCTPLSKGGFMPPGAVLGAIGIGVLATVLVQSSAAVTGLILALAAGGLVNFYTAVPLILGSNIGTTITAQLAAITANRVAKQAAMAHTLFNVIGVLIMLVFLYIPWGAERQPLFLALVNSMTPGNALAVIPQNLSRHIAMAHTIFNVAVTIILLPATGLLAKICNTLIPIRDKVKVNMLEPALLSTPSVALKQSSSAIRMMVEDAWKMVSVAVTEHFMRGESDPESVKQLEESEAKIDEMQEEVTAYLVRLTRRQLSVSQSELVPLLMHCTNDAERIADHVEVILNLTARLKASERKLSDAAQQELCTLWEVLDDQAKHVISALSDTNLKQVKTALKEEEKVAKLADLYETKHIKRLRDGNCTADIGIIFIEMLGELNKIGDRLANISERTPEIQKHYIDLSEHHKESK